MEWRVREDEESKGCSVMEQIGGAPSGNITPRENVLTFVWSFITSELG